MGVNSFTSFLLQYKYCLYIVYLTRNLGRGLSINRLFGAYIYILYLTIKIL